MLHGVSFSACVRTPWADKHSVAKESGGPAAGSEAPVFLQSLFPATGLFKQPLKPRKKNVVSMIYDVARQAARPGVFRRPPQQRPDKVWPFNVKTGLPPLFGGRPAEYPLLKMFRRWEPLRRVELFRKGAGQVAVQGRSFLPASPSPLSSTSWVDVSKIPEADPAVLRSGMEKLARLVQHLSSRKAAHSFFESSGGHTGTPRRNRLFIPRSPGHDEGEAESPWWQLEAAERRTRAHRFRGAPFSGSLQPVPDTGGDAVSPTSFVESAGAPVPRWTNVIGWEKAMESFWPVDSKVVAMAASGKKLDLVRKQTLGIGSFGVVILVESPQAPSTERLKRFAAKLPYAFQQTCDENCWKLMEEEKNAEAATRQALLAAARRQKGMALGTSEKDVLSFLDNQGIVCPLDFLRIWSTPSLSTEPSTSDRFIVPPEVVESPNGLSLYFLNHMTAFDAMGPDLTHLPLGQLDGDMVAYLVYRLVRVVANLHRLHITHNDLKGENFLTHPNGKIYVTDLSMMQLARPDVMVPCADCSPIFVDPQTADCAAVSSSRAPDYARDGWAVGVVLFQLLCNGSKPFLLKKFDDDLKNTMDDARPETIQRGYRAMFRSISRLSRSDWQENHCSGHGSLLSIAKALLDPQHDQRWTPLRLVEKVGFFKDLEGL